MYFSCSSTSFATKMFSYFFCFNFNQISEPLWRTWTSINSLHRITEQFIFDERKKGLSSSNLLHTLFGFFVFRHTCFVIVDRHREKNSPSLRFPHLCHLAELYFWSQKCVSVVWDCSKWFRRRPYWKHLSSKMPHFRYDMINQFPLELLGCQEWKVCVKKRTFLPKRKLKIYMFSIFQCFK